MVVKLKLGKGTFVAEVIPDPYSLIIYRDGRIILTSSARRDLRTKEFKEQSSDLISITFLSSSGKELRLDITYKEMNILLSWGSEDEQPLEDIYVISSAGYWYGGGFNNPQYFPLNDGSIENPWFPHSNVQTPCWFTSSGVVILVCDHKPLYWFFNSGDDGFFRVGRVGSSFKYNIILGTRVRDTYFDLIKIVGKPRGCPDDVLFTRPIYSTWAQYKKAVDQEKTLQYAKGVVKMGFPVGTMEIDDKWEPSYGDFEFDFSKFSDPKAMVKELHEMGFLVTLWVYPFVNLDSKNYSRAKEHGFLVKDQEDKPLMVKWWNGEAGEIDFTNPAAVDWFKGILSKLNKDYGFDGFKFDAGDAIFFPPGSVAHEHISPAEYGDIYMKFIADNFPKISETRVSVFAQELGLLTRHGDKDSKWGIDNGLYSVVTTTLTLSMLGYPYILPDMIGGNEYGNQLCDSELLIRWVQLSSPMPSMQFSIMPWRASYNELTISLNREYAWLHCDLAPYILELVKGSMKDGSPINKPLFFEYDDPNLYKVNDEFMLGNSMLLAPVVAQGAASRDVLLPKGRWLDLWSSEKYNGFTLNDYPAPLHRLPMFLNLDKPLEPFIINNVKRRLLKIENIMKA